MAVGNISRLELEQRQRELVRDLEAASEAQKLIMPPAKGKIARIRYAMRSLSGRYVAGDLFDVVDLEDGRVGVLLGDVAGKGVPAAILMATAQTHLHVALREGKDVSRAVQAVNRHICEHMASNKFISLWAGIFDPAAGTLSYIDAGHGYWMLTRKGQEPLRLDSASGIPLGIDPTFEFAAQTLPITSGQRLIVFSDGVVEQPAAGASDGPQFGVAGAIAAQHGSTCEQDDVQRIFEAVLAHAKGANLADDTTVASVAIE
jgi:sigma-B regulation protein RsbU (phosphoserine phosphatase)